MLHYQCLCLCININVKEYTCAKFVYVCVFKTLKKRERKKERMNEREREREKCNGHGVEDSGNDSGYKSRDSRGVYIYVCMCESVCTSLTR